MPAPQSFSRLPTRRAALGLAGALMTVLWLALGGTAARTHISADHDKPATAAAASNLPRIVTHSEQYELVGIVEGERLTIYLDRFDDNSPVTEATITVMIEGEAVEAEPAADGKFTVTSKRLAGGGPVELVFDIKASHGDDLLIGMLALPEAPTGSIATDMSWAAQAWAALRHAGEDHLGMMGVAILIGAILGLLFRRGRRLRTAVILLLVIPLVDLPTQAHEGHDHGSNNTLAPPSDTARRLPGGQVFVPKPMQRILDVRTVVAKPATVSRGVVLFGRVIANPNRSGLVQSIAGGRVIAPEQGLPRLAQTVRKGEVLATIEPAMPLADRTTISERSGEIEQLIAVAEARLARLRPLAERNVIPMTQVTDAETELQGLIRRREIIRNVRVAPEVLTAPIDGVVASSRIVAGQVVQAQDILFQIVDPQSLWIEAFEYGEIDPAALKEATAASIGGRPMRLEFQGFSRALQQQATLVQFAIIDPPPTLRVGQPVTVTAKKGDEITALVVSRDAVVRGANGETIVWRHIEPERFDARLVRIEPFDATNVLIAAGIASGERIVTRGAELINQIR
jgi:cobalt-zinc-cadmium efflux system membrane fusion protein